MHIVTFRVLRVTYRSVLDWIIRFIDTLFTQLRTAGNYSAIADLHTTVHRCTRTRILSLH
jgi:hypothetical protein